MHLLLPGRPVHAVLVWRMLLVQRILGGLECLPEPGVTARGVLFLCQRVGNLTLRASHQ